MHILKNSIDFVGDIPATFQYGPLHQDRNDDVDAGGPQVFKVKVFKRIPIRRYRTMRSSILGLTIAKAVKVMVKKIVEIEYLLCGEHKNLKAYCC